jgi:hypothetical protein
VEAAFPFGDIDLAVHVPSGERTGCRRDNVVCDVKSTLDGTLWDDHLPPPAA